MILKRYNDKRTGTEFIEMVKTGLRQDNPMNYLRLINQG